MCQIIVIFRILNNDSLLIYTIGIIYLFHLQEPPSKWCQGHVKNGWNGKQLFVKKLEIQILCSSDHSILFKFHQCAVKIFIKELQTT